MIHYPFVYTYATDQLNVANGLAYQALTSSLTF
jgi:hypothetical protein